ncbi:MAG TPA: PAS domain S-box protein, partial [Bacteroidia bacterium]|nr:PAS domain S-box protein [Bacteroidia bacterium]
MTDAVTKILIVEHDSNDIELIQRELKKGNIKHVTEIVETENAYINALRNFAPDIILCDYSLPAFNGLAAFEIREKISPDTPFIFVSGTIGEENSIELIRNGVTDFALKDKLFSLSVKVNRALKEAKEAQKKQAVEKALIQSEINLRAIFESTDTGLLLIDTNFKIISFNKQVNHFAEKSFGFPFRENVSFIEMFMPERQGEFNDMLDKVLKGETINYETTYPLTNGKIIWYKIKGNPVLNQGRNVIGICVTIDNITARKKSEQKLIKVNRLYYFISQINQMIVHITDEQTLFKEACNIAIDIGKFRMAWIGMIDEETKKVIPVMHAGEESGYLSKIKVIPLDTEPKEKGPVGTAMRENRHIICNNIETDPLMAPWKAEALNRGYRSLIALPIKKFGKIAGAFSLYSSELNFFDDAEIALLDEVTGDISFALENYEKEEQRKRTEEIIHEREQSLSSIYNTTADIIFVLEIEKSERYLFSSVNNAFVRTTGIPHNAVIGKYVNDIVPQPSLNLVLEKYKEAIEQKKIVRWEETSDYPNGRLTGEVSVSPTFDKTGNCIRLVGAVHDITER